MLSRNLIQARYFSLLILVALFSISAFSQERRRTEIQPPPGTVPFTLKGSLAFKQGYSPKEGDREFLKGQVLVLKDKASGKVLGKATTGINGGFEFTNVAGSGGANPMTMRVVCNDRGDCFDFQPLKPDDPGPLKPIEWPDPPLQPMKRVARPAPPLAFNAFSCVPQTGGQAIKMTVRGWDARTKPVIR